jgi:acyl-coenzyme A synthetase/AMP-(fatty) acid ligase
MSFVDNIIFHARMTPERPAIILSDRAVTYHMLVQGMLAVENRLAMTALKRGDVAAIMIENPIRHFTVLCALYRIGISSVSVSRESLAEGGLKIAVVLSDRPVPAGVLVDDSWFPSRPTNADAPLRPAFAADQICRIRYSTGTTGGRKAIGFTPGDLEWDVAVRMTMFAGTGWQRMLCLSNYHYNGFSYALLALVAGNTLLFADAPGEALRIIDLYAVDVVVASPQHLREMITAQREMSTSLPSLKLISVGGASMEEALRIAAQARLCKTILSVYSATESGPIAIGTVERMREFGNATGFVTPWAKVEVLGEDGTVLPSGEEGTLRVRPQRQARVLTDAAANAAGDTWFLPGDRGKLLPNGVLIVTARTSDMIDIGGTKVAPERIEELLLRRSDISDAAAVGVEADGGQQLWVAVVPRGPGLDPRDVAAYLKAQNPAFVAHQVKIVDRIPRGESGKVRRRQLRDDLTGGR